MKKITTTLIINLLIITCYANKNLKLAEEKFTNEHYKEAINLYQKALESKINEHEKLDAIYKIGLSYHIILNHTLALIWFNKLIKVNPNNANAYYFIGLSHKALGNASEAINAFQELAKKDPDYTKTVNTEIASCNLIEKWKNEEVPINIYKNHTLSTENHDVAVRYLNNTEEVILSSYNSDYKEISEITGVDFPDLSISQSHKNIWNLPTAITDTVNSKFSEGAAYFSKKHQILILTRCLVIKNTKQNCQLYYSKKFPDNTYANPKKIAINDSVDIGHPVLNSKEDTLYFSANLPNSIGGKDIWKTHISFDNDSIHTSDPINLGSPINTQQDELFPYIGPDNELYFSSNGHITIGGFDIFKLNFKGEVENLKTPLNSTGDDLSITLHPELFKGFIASNRDNQDGQLDIYEFSVHKPEIKQDSIIDLPYIVYDFDYHTLTNESKDSLMNLVKTLQNNPKLKIEILSHTDFKGSESYNMKLSQRRAQSVVNFLIQNGIEKHRLQAKGMGELKPREISEKFHYGLNKQIKKVIHIGDKLTEEFILNIENKTIQDFLNHMNRRTEFRIIQK